MPSASIPAAAIAADATATGATVASVGGVTAGSVLAAGSTGAVIGAGGASAASILSTVGTVGSALGGVTGAIGAVESARAQGESASYAAPVAANNSVIASQNATLANAAGASQVEQQGLKTRATVGAIAANQAASNINVDTGSAVDVRSSASELGQLSDLTIRSNAEKTVYGYETQGVGFQSQQGLEQMEASQAPVAGAIGAGTSLLSGATGAATKYAAWTTASGGGGTNPLTNWGT
jgi:hypothetical protein